LSFSSFQLTSFSLSLPLFRKASGEGLLVRCVSLRSLSLARSLSRCRSRASTQALAVRQWSRLRHAAASTVKVDERRRRKKILAPRSLCFVFSLFTIFFPARSHACASQRCRPWTSGDGERDWKGREKRGTDGESGKTTTMMRRRAATTTTTPLSFSTSTSSSLLSLALTVCFFSFRLLHHQNTNNNSDFPLRRRGSKNLFNLSRC